MKKAIKAHTHYTQEVRRHLESVFNINELLFYSLCGSVLQISIKVYPFRSKSAQAGYEAFKSRHLNANRRLQVGLFLIVWPTDRVQSLSFSLQAVNGQAIDRHLLGLKLAALESRMNLPELFMDSSYQYALHYKLSTSQVGIPFSVYSHLVSQYQFKNVSIR